MKNSEPNSPASSFTGHVKNGVIVLDVNIDLQDSLHVRIKPLVSGQGAAVDMNRAELVRRVQDLFTQWTEEDSRLYDEEAGRLRAALEKSHGLQLGSPTLD
jgi:hypothetical protein